MTPKGKKVSGGIKIDKRLCNQNAKFPYLLYKIHKKSMEFAGTKMRGIETKKNEGRTNKS